MVAPPWSSSRLSCGERLLLSCDGNAGIFPRPRRERIPPLELGGGNVAPLDVGGTLVLPLEWRHARVPSSRAVAAVSCFPWSGSRDLWLSHDAFPRGFPQGFATGLSHVPPWCESILGLEVEAAHGKQVSLKWTESSGGLWEWWQDPGVPLAFPVESPSS